VEPLVGQRGFALAGVVITIGGLIALMASSHWVTGPSSVTGTLAKGQGNVKQLGTAVFTTYLYAFEATSLLLVIASWGRLARPSRTRHYREMRDEVSS